MKILLIDDKKITKYNLPSKIEEDFLINYQSDDLSSENTITIEATNSKWKLRSNGNVNIVNGNVIEEDVILEDYSYHYLKLLGRKTYIVLFSVPSAEKQMFALSYSNTNKFTIGSGANANISYRNSLTNDIQATISLEDNIWVIRSSENLKSPVFINNKATTYSRLRYGDIIFINGLRIVWMKDFIKINNPNGSVKTHGLTMYNKDLTQNNSNCETVSDEDSNTDLYTLDDYFYHIPRIKETIEPKEIVIDSPPNNQMKEDVPFWLTLGSSFTMLASSSVMFFSVYNNLSTGKTIMNCLPQIIMMVAMLLGSVIMPRLLKSFQKKRAKQNEKLRQEKYKEYLNSKEEEMKQEMKHQSDILNDNNEHVIKCYEKVMTRGRNLWNREILDDDFLTVRLGLGTADTQMTVKAPEEHFTLQKDNLFESVYKVVEETKKLTNVPITYSFLKNPLTSIIFNCSYKNDYLNGLMTQLVSFQSGADLKIVIMTNSKNDEYWNYAKILPHCWNDTRTVRYYSTNLEELNEVSNDLDMILRKRRDSLGSSNDDQNSGYRNFQTYYLVLTDDYQNVKNCQFILDLLKENNNLGFSLIAIADSMKNLPNRCEKFVQISEQNSCILSKELNTQSQIQFANEHVKEFDMDALSTKLANIPIMSKDGLTQLPPSLSFLEMFNVSKIEQLNILNRWQMNNPVISLATTVGVHSNLEPFKLDLHEKFHGPHGLIAGSTGSGKSEFIITYILSMALNYHPYEVQFVLIDYKGGGLAGAFENKETKVKLPHLIGTITNLDTSEMNRTLVSIESELKRRQKIFNATRDSLGESTIDIYKYQRLYREGAVKEPMAHLFIISDEFAELKSQQPEFMAQLISTARIGRSLGVHLILATQKPSGVVNDQIWSNSKFRVCLKVQDRSDSMEMLKRPEAASIKETGRFYLQVGYDDYFDIGQSGWSGAKYIPSNRIVKKVDDSIDFINNVGYITKSINNNVKKDVTKDLGDQLTNTVKYLYNLAAKENIKTNPLWLPTIPPVIYIYDLKDKYKYTVDKFDINPIIGELDDARSQSQSLLTLPISKNGNTLIYGMAGSGKENALNTIITSTIAFHSPEEINFYILDFGSETLKVFKDSPQVGDVCTIESPEKIENLFKMLKKEIDIRKDLFIDYNGDMNLYNKNSGSTVPNIVVVVNNYEVFMENYQVVEDDLTMLSREGIKYGIYFIITASGVNSIRYKLSQNFSNMLVLQLVNDTDYQTLLGNTGKLYPARIFGRGIIKTDNFYEFQTACLTDPEKLLDQIKIMNQKLSGMYPNKARRIPVLPEVVTLDFLKSNITELSKIPVGVEKDSLKVSTFDFVNNDITIVGTNDIYQIKPFVLGLSKVISEVSNTTVVMIDLINMFNEFKENNIVYFDKGFDSVVEKLEIDIKRKLAINDKPVDVNRTVLVLVGVTSLSSKVTPENFKKFNDMLEKIRSIKTVSAIIIDNIMNLKRVEYETWYKSNIDASNGIYIGSGVSDQYSIKITKNTKEMRMEVPYCFGYSVKRGIPTLIKVIEENINEDN